MLGKHALENAPEIHGRPQVSTFIQVFIRESRPVGEDLPAIYGTARKHSRGGGPVVRASRSVDSNRTTKFGHKRYDRVAPGLSQRAAQVGEPPVEGCEPIG